MKRNPADRLARGGGSMASLSVLARQRVITNAVTLTPPARASAAAVGKARARKEGRPYEPGATALA